MRLFPALHCSHLALYWILAEGFIRELNLTYTCAVPVPACCTCCVHMPVDLTYLLPTYLDHLLH
ncbi:hypothetical protein J6590_064191 [Homalodisca vitripennis]|nr:hypothetical protein J6590_064191 [Homalodisca vitripennis]